MYTLARNLILNWERFLIFLLERFVWDILAGNLRTSRYVALCLMLFHYEHHRSVGDISKQYVKLIQANDCCQFCNRAFEKHKDAWHKIVKRHGLF
jgi:hypothetical protein